jgi:hypothetical protein
MNAATLDHGGQSSSHWVRRTLLVIFCLGLLAALGAVFTRMVAARVPEQRATLEKLITDRTGLAVRFDNVHFAWGMDGTSAVFERVELTDPVRGRVRVVAPELRVEFNTWDFLRHQQFSLGHVTLKSPDIDIVGDAAPARESPSSTRSGKRGTTPEAELDEASLIRRYTAWAELMPIGRVEVEAARVHLFRRGEQKARHNFTLSQAVVSRGGHSFNAFGTLLLSQDIGQSLFVSAKLEGVGAVDAGVDGELRLIARRVFLDKLSSLSLPGVSLAARGRGTVDARLKLRDGRIADGSWQLSARELELPQVARFDHFTVQGSLRRAQEDFLLEFTDLQLTRGARLERAPKLSLRLDMAPGALRVARATASAERLPFMAAEFLAGSLGARSAALAGVSTEWRPTAGEMRAVRFDSRARTFSAQVSGAEFTRADHARISNLSMQVQLEQGQARLAFDRQHSASMSLASREPRELSLAGSLTLRAGAESTEMEFAGLNLRSGAAEVRADGRWGAPRGLRGLDVDVKNLDRMLLGDAWSLLSLQEFKPLADVAAGQVVTGRLSLLPALDAQGLLRVDRQRSRGSLQLADLATAGADVPQLSAAAGQLEFARGGAQLRLTTGKIEELAISDARLEWPRRGEPRLRATARGDLRAPLLRRTLESQGLQRLSGEVTLEAEARGDAEMRHPESWRITARLDNASLPLSAGLPAVEKLSGTARLAAGQLRGLTLAGQWLGGTVEIESRRATGQGVQAAAVRGVADAAPLLKLLGQPEAAARVSGQLAWSGTLQRSPDADAAGQWQATLTSNLSGVESRLPEPFDKPRARALQVEAQLRFDERGIHEFSLASGRDSVRGRTSNGITTAQFNVQGVAGEWRTTDAARDPQVTVSRLELRRAPALLAAAGAMLPAEGGMLVKVADLRHAERTLGALDASLSRGTAGVEFSLESAPGSTHELDATGHCLSDAARCELQFTVDTRQLPALLGDTKLPVEWPTQTLHASGVLAWTDAPDLTRALTGAFELETQGADSGHQLMASAQLHEGIIELSNVQGAGPEPDQVFRGSGRVGLLARTYDLTIDYEKVSLAASAVPTPARARLARAWTSLRGSAAGRGWTETVPARRVQWHGNWE